MCVCKVWMYSKVCTEQFTQASDASGSARVGELSSAPQTRHLYVADEGLANYIASSRPVRQKL